MGVLNRRRNTADVFADIYRTGRWGGEGEMHSGAGSVHEGIIRQYVFAVRDEIERLGMSGKCFVDIGCGDFRVGSRVASFAGSYIGVDVVPALIKHLSEVHRSERTSFRCINAIDDPLPEGDVCFVRQVFQHLSNDQILRILPKFEAYQHVFITEHIPNRRKPYTPNLDKTQGPDIRLYWNSGVFLDKAPFSVPASKIREILSVSGTPVWSGEDPGEIVTWVYTPSAVTNAHTGFVPTTTQLRCVKSS
jgi:hypothetical protein